MQGLYRFLAVIAIVVTSGAFYRLAAQATPPPGRQLTVALFTTNAQLPGGTMRPMHPGIHLGLEFPYNKSLRNQWFQTAKLGGFYHRYAQTAVQLFSEAGYRRIWGQKFGTEFRLGAGYLHAFPALQVFELENGTYRQKHFYGRAQFMASATGGLSYRISPHWRVFAEYQMILQMPFVNEYVIMLPNTSVHAGVAIPMPSFKK